VRLHFLLYLLPSTTGWHDIATAQAVTAAETVMSSFYCFGRSSAVMQQQVQQGWSASGVCCLMKHSLRPTAVKSHPLQWSATLLITCSLSALTGPDEAVLTAIMCIDAFLKGVLAH
jgi:hypothetical protein